MEPNTLFGSNDGKGRGGEGKKSIFKILN